VDVLGLDWTYLDGMRVCICNGAFVVNSILSTAPSSLVLASGIPNTPVASGLNGVSSTGGAISIRVAASENGRTHSHERQRDHNGNGSSNSICSSSSSNGAGSGSDNSHDAATPQTASEAGKKANANGKKRSAPNDFDKELIAKFRKESHSALEQRRRDKINDGINQLKELVEPYHNGKYDKASVLRKSIEYIQQVNEGLNSLRELLDPHDVSKHNRVNTLRKSSEYIKQAQHLQRRLVEENYALREDNGQLQACLDVIRTENRLLRIEITKLRPELQHLRAEDEDTMAKVVEASKAKSEISVPSSSPSPPLASSSSVSSGASSVASFFSTSVRPPLHASWLESVALAKTHSPPYSKKHMIERTESNMSSVHS